MSKNLYLECYSGISGDMTVAALLDLGADKEVLLNALNSLKVSGFKIEISRVKKSGIDACDFNVILDEHHENHDHDMAYLHGHDTETYEHIHESEHHHKDDENYGHYCEEVHEHGNKEPDKYQKDGHYHDCHDKELYKNYHNQLNHQEVHYGHVHNDEEHDNIHEHHHHEHRGLPEILEIIYSSEMTENAKKTAAKIFNIIAHAEAKAHGTEINNVHFHEVGAIDSIVDIAAVAVCLDNLNISDVVVTELYEGRGIIRCQHGIIPVPVPAVLNILEANNLNISITETEGELITPTGAAIVAAVKTKDKLPAKFKIKKIGLGAGKRNYDRPSILRAMIIEDAEDEHDVIYKLETNIDDCSGENFGYVMERLFENGARDVNYTPIFMKKNRPAYMLNVICRKEDVEKLEYIIFAETTTIGIRKTVMERTVLKRTIKEIDSSVGKAKIKVCRLGDMVKCYPEYESIAAICKEKKMSYTDVYSLIQNEMKELCDEGL